MATFTTIADTVLEPGKPIRSVDTLALRDNPIAIADGETNAPRIRRRALAPESFGFELFTASGTFTVPADVTLLKVTVVGGGGGGGGGGTSVNPVGGNGGGGGFSRGFVSVSPGASISVIIGGGGNAGTTNINGGGGGTSSFNGTVIQATGGGGGISGINGGANGAAGTGSGSSRNTLTAMQASIPLLRPRAGGSTGALVYSVGSVNAAGIGGSGESAAFSGDSTGGVAGAVLIEF